jgi:cell division septum initiation protein DivIVA
MSIADLENEIEALRQEVAALKQRADESDANMQRLMSMVEKSGVQSSPAPNMP